MTHPANLHNVCLKEALIFLHVRTMIQVFKIIWMFCISIQHCCNAWVFLNVKLVDLRPRAPLECPHRWIVGHNNMRQPNYHSHWREWMHSRHWIMNAQFQGIHSLHSCCWVFCRHVGFFICLGTNLLYNCCDNIITLKYLQSCEKLISKHKKYMCKCLIIFFLFMLDWGRQWGCVCGGICWF